MDDQLSSEEREQLAALGKHLQPPAGLEDRVAAALRQRKLIAAPPGWSLLWRLTAAAAAATVVFAAFALGVRYERSAPAPAPEGRRFLLMLLEPADAPLPAAEEAARGVEYRDWAGELARNGLLDAGEKLAWDGNVVSGTGIPVAPVAERVTGFFIVRAASLDEALGLARECPHVVHGGRVEVREIEPT